SSARRPTASTAPSSASASAPSAMGGVSIGTTQRALTNFTTPVLLLLGDRQTLVTHVAPARREAGGADVAFDVVGAELEDRGRLGHDILLDHPGAEVVAAEAQGDLADLGAPRRPRNLEAGEVVQVEARQREHAQVTHRRGVVTQLEPRPFRLERPADERGETGRLVLQDAPRFQAA